MQKVIRWSYRIFLVAPVVWLLMAMLWYWWVILTYGEIPYNEELYAVHKDSPEGKTLDAFYSLGIPILVAMVISAYSAFAFFAVHLGWAFYTKKPSYAFAAKHDGVVIFCVATIFAISFLRNPFLKYLNYLLD